jgi:hypothetical protein
LLGDILTGTAEFYIAIKCLLSVKASASLTFSVSKELALSKAAFHTNRAAADSAA